MFGLISGQTGCLTHTSLARTRTRKKNGLVGIGKANSLAHHLNFTDAQVRIPNTVAAGSNPAVGFVVTPCLVNRRRIRYMSVVSQVHVGREWLLKARAVLFSAQWRVLVTGLLPVRGRAGYCIRVGASIHSPRGEQTRLSTTWESARQHWWAGKRGGSAFALTPSL